MYRYVAASIGDMLEDWDLEDFGDIVASRLRKKLDTQNISVDEVYISNNRYGEHLNVNVTIEGEPFIAECKLDGRRISHPRHLISRYSEVIIGKILDQLYGTGIFSASYSMKQEFSSKQTASGNGSYNKGKGRVPALFKKISWVPGTINFDYGCGYKSTQERIAEYLSDYGVDYIGFDKFNQTPAEQKNAWDTVEWVGGVDTATCANVLNVVKEREVRVDEIITNIYDALKPGGVAYFDVYEGDKSSSGGQTGKDNYQLKRPVDGYLEEVAEVFGDNNVQLKGKLIIAKK